MPRSIPLALVVASITVALAIAARWRDRDDGARCGRGFEARGARCLVPPGACPPPLVAHARGCDAPDVRVLVPATEMVAGPSDWESEGRVAPRVVRAGAFRVDAFEATAGAWQAAMGGAPDAEPARAMSGISRAEAAEYCGRRGGRLPSEDEWIVAAASGTVPPRRYPWGDTGAVCRRAAWGLRTGPCSTRGGGPDTVGSHADGATPLGLYDVAGNVAEWIAPASPGVSATGRDESPDALARPSGAVGMAKGGSWQSALAADLRIWSRVELPASERDPSVGVRCVYPP